MQKPQILWADDEIDLLKPHILFLRSKGYDIVSVNNGEDAVERVSAEPFDLVFLDEQMPGVSGIEALQRIKAAKPTLPVIMITKSEEEHIMEDAIGSKITDYLIKPVNPNQILLAIKKVLDKGRLVSETTTRGYQRDFQELSMTLGDRLDAAQWTEAYKKLVYWELELQASTDDGMREVFAAQWQEANAQFCKFVEKEYLGWLSHPDEDTPVLSHQAFKQFVLPEISEELPTVLLLIDNLRMDQWKVLEPMFGELFQIEKEESYFAMLPTATEFARNAFFAGLTPSEIRKRFPQLWVDDSNTEESSKNAHEAEFLADQLKRLGKPVKHSYTKVTNLPAGKDLAEKALQLLQGQLGVVVYNFVDMLSHARSEMNMIKELAEDEAAYRSITASWFEHSPLLETLKKLAEKPCKLILTTDHGCIRVKTPVRIVGDRDTTTNLRYKEGRNLNYDKKAIFTVRNPEDAFLPRPHVSSTYAFCAHDEYFVYPNSFNHYVNLYRNTFQHGGISLEEIIVPVVTMRSRS
jgi:CheY-like chemotaxis protein